MGAAQEGKGTTHLRPDPQTTKDSVKEGGLQNSKILQRPDNSDIEKGGKFQKAIGQVDDVLPILYKTKPAARLFYR